MEYTVTNTIKNVDDKVDEFIVLAGYDTDPLQITELLELNESEAYRLAKKYGGEIWQKRVQLAEDGFLHQPFSIFKVEEDD